MPAAVATARARSCLRGLRPARRSEATVRPRARELVRRAAGETRARDALIADPPGLASAEPAAAEGAEAEVASRGTRAATAAAEQGRSKGERVAGRGRLQTETGKGMSGEGRARGGKPGQCEHKRQRSRCKECGGASICEHNRIGNECKECGGASICEHKRRKSSYKECGWASICEHNRRTQGQGVQGRKGRRERSVTQRMSREDGGGSSKLAPSDGDEEGGTAGKGSVIFIRKLVSQDSELQPEFLCYSFDALVAGMTIHPSVCTAWINPYDAWMNRAEKQASASKSSCLYVGSASSCCVPQWLPMAASSALLFEIYVVRVSLRSCYSIYCNSYGCQSGPKAARSKRSRRWASSRPSHSKEYGAAADTDIAG